ncbi:hypothetical protein WICPIJ_009111 [Wickerhamomyces pijperi]|uniref:Uncharacterized protein n=1 Tax=Wickerhamomyces pijperi TaxID=599730 RepID=A0A9P8PRW4_WICPI|nr:hypothetical protein WICPIJ_009111 [Wickerhamomyces pijperi]
MWLITTTTAVFLMIMAVPVIRVFIAIRATAVITVIFFIFLFLIRSNFLQISLDQIITSFFPPLEMSSEQTLSESSQLTKGITKTNRIEFILFNDKPVLVQQNNVRQFTVSVENLFAFAHGTCQGDIDTSVRMDDFAIDVFDFWRIKFNVDTRFLSSFQGGFFLEIFHSILFDFFLDFLLDVSDELLHCSFEVY